MVFLAKGLKDKNSHEYRIGRGLAKGLPIYTSVAITQGIVPLLFVQLIYGPMFYTSSVLIAVPWFAIIFILLVAYFLLYWVVYKASPGPSEDSSKYPKAKYGPKIICLGEKYILPSLEKELLNKESGSEIKIDLKAKDAFGIKDPKYIKIISIEVLKEQNINPFPGLQINADGMFGTIRSVTGGRVNVDFNHPLAGKNVSYELKINKIITDDQEKLKSMLGNELGLSSKQFNLKIEEKKVKISLKSIIHPQIKEKFSKRVKGLIPALEVSFS